MKSIVSIVSHGNIHPIKKVLDDLSNHAVDFIDHIILTYNIPEEDINLEDYALPIHIVKNTFQKSFSKNHNDAFNLIKDIDKDFLFLVLNPDVRITDNIFPSLVKNFNDESVGIAAPKILSSNGDVEDNARDLLTLKALFKRVFLKKKTPASSTQPDWIAGMFMLFSPSAFKKINGFDEKYRLYCEDADICNRMWLHGYKVCIDNSVCVIHDAQRLSHKKLKYFYWHMSSLLKLLCSQPQRSALRFHTIRKMRSI